MSLLILLVLLKMFYTFIAYLMSTKQEAELGVGAFLVGEGEIFDEVITRSRGEFRHVSSPKITSSIATPSNDPKSFQSPHALYNPRIGELKGELSPQSSGRGPHSPRTPQSHTPKS